MSGFELHLHDKIIEWILFCVWFLSLSKMVLRVTHFVGFISSFSQIGFPRKTQRLASRALIKDASWDLQLWQGREGSRNEQREE